MLYFITSVIIALAFVVGVIVGGTIGWWKGFDYAIKNE